jgi:hypothetical protein
MVEHTRRASQIEADRVQVQFGPEVLGALRELEHTLRRKKPFDGDVYFLLQTLASGKPIGIKSALVDLVMIGEQTTKYVHATGDREASAAWHEVTGHLIGQSKDATPVTVEVAPKQRAR